LSSLFSDLGAGVLFSRWSLSFKLQECGGVRVCVRERERERERKREREKEREREREPHDLH
jgi:hypothetical protein